MSVGWPSFSDVADKGNVARIVDTSFGMTRTEVVCAKVPLLASDVTISHHDDAVVWGSSWSCVR